VTFAMMLAAAMLKLSASPPTSAVCGSGNGRTGRPSMSTCCGGGSSCATALRIAWCVARRILMRSISSCPTIATAQRIFACAVISM